MKYQFFVLISILIIFSCKSEEKNNIGVGVKKSYDNATIWKGEMTIKDTFVIKENHSLVIEPGANITFAPAAVILAHGNLFIEGTEENPITLHAKDPIKDHRIIWGKSGCKKLTIYHTKIINGLITSYMTNNHFNHVTFKNSEKLRWNDAAARFWFGKVLLENCTFNWNNQGEGFLLHKVQKPIIQNCHFDQLPDAVEYIHCSDGIIRDCVFSNCGDDAIDQNHCSNTLIQNNEFYNIKDRALELGSEKFGKSDSIRVINNLFVGCKVAINVKESSNAYIENATFYNNDISLDIYTHKDSSIISQAKMINSVMVGSRMPVSANPRSVADIYNSMSDKLPKKAPKVPVKDIEFANPSKKDFTIISNQFPKGMNAKTIGYIRKK